MVTYLTAITSAGEMSFRDIQNECGKEGWAPLVVYDVEIEGKTQTVLPVFTNENVCRDWCKRNLPKEWKLFGGCFLEKEDLETLEAKGWRFQSFSFPRKIKDIVNEFRVEPCELNSKPDVYAR